MESELRLVLLGVGLIVIGFFVADAWRRYTRVSKLKQFNETYLHNPNQSNFVDDELYTEGDLDPLLIDEHDLAAIEDPNTTVSSVTSHNVVVDEVIALRLLPAKDSYFSGEKIASLLEKFGLTHEPVQKVYYAKLSGDSKQIAFSVANAFEPGTLSSPATSSPVYGLVFFMMIPSHGEAAASFDKLLLTAKRMSAALEGGLYDTQEHPISNQMIQGMRERVIEGVRRLMLSSKRS